MITPEIAGTLIAAAFTLMVYSFFYRENKAYRFAEHVFIGLAVAHGAVISSKYVWDAALTPLITKGEMYWILPIIVGLLFTFFFSKKYFWVYRIPISIVVGTGVGLAMAGLVRSQFIDQIVQTIAPLDPKADFWSSGSHPVNALLIAIGTLGTLFFFIFTREQKGPLLYASHIGRWTMMIAFGAAFGFTVMARMSLLIGRMQFLIDPSGVAWYMIPVAILVVAAVAFMDRAKGSKP